MSQPSSGGSDGGNGAAIGPDCRLSAIHAPSSTAAQAAAMKSIPAGAIVMGPAIRGRPAKTHQKPAKKAAGEYQLPPDLRAAHAIAGRSRKMAAVSQFTLAILLPILGQAAPRTGRSRGPDDWVRRHDQERTEDSQLRI